MKIDYESKKLSIDAEIALLTKQKEVLVEFVENFILSWEDGMGGDSSVYKDAQAVLKEVK